MGLRCEYFVASDDSVAAAVAGWPSGPSVPPKPSGWRRRPEPPLPTVHAGTIDPVVLMGILEGLLVEVDDGPLIDRSAASQLAEGPSGQRWVFAMADRLFGAIAAADPARLEVVATRWAAAEEFAGGADPAELGRGLAELAGLARRAIGAGARVYCWMSL